MILLGAPVFVSLKREAKVPVVVMAPSSSRKMCGAKGSITWSVESAGPFVSYALTTVKALEEARIDSSVGSYLTGLVRAGIGNNDVEQLKSDHSILENGVSEGASKLGLKGVLSLDYVGQPTPEMAQAMISSQMHDAAGMMAGVAEQMRSAQMHQLQGQPQNTHRDGTSSTTPVTSQSTLACSTCGASNPGTGKFCNNCGKLLIPKMQTCPKCGQEVAPGIKFCSNCGNKM